MLSSIPVIARVSMLLGASALLAGCSSFGLHAKSAAVPKPAVVQTAAVDADIQRILAAGGIDAGSPVATALQTPPSAWEGEPVQVAEVAQTLEVQQPQVAQPAGGVLPALPAEIPAPAPLPAEPAGAPPVVAVASTGNNYDFTRGMSPVVTANAPVSTGLSAAPMLSGSLPSIPPAPGQGEAVPLPTGTGAIGNASVSAGILPPPIVTQEVVVVTGPEGSAAAQPVSRPRVVRPPIPAPRPAHLGGSAVASVSVAAPVSPKPVAPAVPSAAPVVSAPLQSLPTANSDRPAAPVKRF